MNLEFEKRKKKAEEISVLLENILDGLMIVGSVAYNSDAVTEKSDLDLVGITDFSKCDFGKLFSLAKKEVDNFLIENARTGKVNTVSLVWDEDFEIGLHLWDFSAFENIVNLKKSNFVFRPKDFDKNFRSTSDSEFLLNLERTKKEFFKSPVQIEGGKVLEFFICIEEEDSFYIGIQLTNLLLNPKVIFEEDNFISGGLKKFEFNLKEKLKEIHGVSSKEINLFNALNEKSKLKIGPGLRSELVNYF